LTLGLDQDYESRTIMLKRFACHITAHTAVEAMIELRAKHGFSGNDVASIQIDGSRRMATVNNIPQPADILIAQFSIPFCAALALYRNALDPYSFDEGSTRDAAIMSMASKVKMTAVPGQAEDDVASNVTLTLKDGRVLTQRVTEFLGTPARPLTGKEMREKFALLTQKYPSKQMERIYERLQNLEAETNLEWLHV
jgi:2-methylcitrate dehydratase PrpD